MCYDSNFFLEKFNNSILVVSGSLGCLSVHSEASLCAGCGRHVPADIASSEGPPQSVEASDGAERVAAQRGQLRKCIQFLSAHHGPCGRRPTVFEI